MDFNASLCCHFSFSNVQLMFEDEAEHLIGLTLTQLVGGTVRAVFICCYFCLEGKTFLSHLTWRKVENIHF